MDVLGLTGTPGTGKTTLAEGLAAKGWSVLHLSELIPGTGETKKEPVEVEPTHLAKLAKRGLAELSQSDPAKPVVIEGHLAHELGLSEYILVLRCHPQTLAERLAPRGYSQAKVAANCEAEALDLILVEALEAAKADNIGKAKVVELDTTAMSVEQAVKAVKAWISGDRSQIQSPGTARYLADFLGLD